MIHVGGQSAIQTSSKTDKPYEDLQNALAISLEMNILDQLLKWQFLGDLGEIEAVMLNRARL